MRRGAILLLLALAAATQAEAHSAERGFVLLLPTGYVILAGALAVLVSFCAVSSLPARMFHAAAIEAQPAHPGTGFTTFVSLTSASILLFLIWIGFAGPRDPAENLLPLAVWTLWWVVIVLLHPLLGNLWSALNPFSGLHAISKQKPCWRYPAWLSYWPALLIFAAFAWFQLVHPGPDDPARLALVVTLYAGFTLLAVFAFGPEAWLGKADPFAVFLSQLGAAAPLGPNFTLRWPGAGLASRAALPLAGTLFVLLTLGSISFDGFANTFLWLSAVGVNPLEYPGRTAMVSANTLGLAGSFVLLTAIYALSVSAGWFWAGKPNGIVNLMGRFIFSLIPISIAYHLAHYLSDTLVSLQYVVLALNDPLGSAANLFGLDHFHVTASFQNTASGAVAIFTAQITTIVIGHVIGVAVAHMMALQIKLPRRNVLKLEAPLAAFMVAYTAFGLWLLSTPSIS